MAAEQEQTEEGYVPDDAPHPEDESQKFQGDPNAPHVEEDEKDKEQK